MICCVSFTTINIKNHFLWIVLLHPHVCFKCSLKTATGGSLESVVWSTASRAAELARVCKTLSARGLRIFNKHPFKHGLIDRRTNYLNRILVLRIPKIKFYFAWPGSPWLHWANSIDRLPWQSHLVPEWHMFCPEHPRVILDAKNRLSVFSVLFDFWDRHMTSPRSLCTSVDSEPSLKLSNKQSDHNLYLSHQEESEKCRQNQFLPRKKIVKRSGMRSQQISQSRFNSKSSSTSYISMYF